MIFLFLRLLCAVAEAVAKFNNPVLGKVDLLGVLIGAEAPFRECLRKPADDFVYLVAGLELLKGLLQPG